MSRSPRRFRKSVRAAPNYIWISVTVVQPVIPGGVDVTQIVIGDDWQSNANLEKGALLERLIVTGYMLPDPTASLFPTGDYFGGACWHVREETAFSATNPTDAASFGSFDVFGLKWGGFTVGGVGLTAGFLGTNMVVRGYPLDSDLKVRRKLTDKTSVDVVVANDAGSDDDITFSYCARALVRLPR